jgi:hypothetical protein
MRDRLDLLLAAAERITVDLIAQEPVAVRPSTDTPGWARHVVDAESFDVLPVLEDDGRIVSYLRRSTLERHASEVDWTGIAFETIEPDEIVSATTPLLEVLGRFTTQRPRLFVLGRRHIDGIVTVYDLNQPAAHQFGFALALVVEAELGRAIETAVRDADDELGTEVDQSLLDRIEDLPASEIPGAKGRGRSWKRKNQRGEQVRLACELSFSDKIELVRVLGLAPDLAARCRPPYGSSPTEFVSRLKSEVKALRNAVAHDRGELADEHSIWQWMRTTYHLATDLSSYRAA